MATNDCVTRPLDFKELSPAQMLENSRQTAEQLARRRTVRDFSDRAVDPEIIDNAIRAAATAPSGANKQPWHFVVISNAEIKKAIREAAEEEERAFYGGRATESWLADLKQFGTDSEKPFLEVAPYLIAVFLERSSIDEDGVKHKNYYMPESVGIASGMLLTALHNSGLATLTHTPSPMGFLSEILKRPNNEKPYLLVVTGYPAGDAQVPDIERKPFEEVCSHFS
ncbi:MAG: nitroreductase family protein [Cellvibrionaceae bacterium]